MFQSLLFWMRVLNTPVVWCKGGRARVSILVVLDAGPQQSFLVSRAATARCFNPCCSGCGSSTLWERYRTRAGSCFNPCCSGCGSSTKITDQATYCWWNVSILVVLDAGPQLLIGLPLESMPSSFNPCCSGCGSSTWLACSPGRLEPAVSILVVLDAGPQQRSNAPVVGSLICFNPCCSGCGSSTAHYWQVLKRTGDKDPF